MQGYELARKKIKDELFFKFSSSDYMMKPTKSIYPTGSHYCISNELILKIKKGNVYINNIKIDDPSLIGQKIINAAKSSNG